MGVGRAGAGSESARELEHLEVVERDAAKGDERTIRQDACVGVVCVALRVGSRKADGTARIDDEGAVDLERPRDGQLVRAEGERRQIKARIESNAGTLRDGGWAITPPV